MYRRSLTLGLVFTLACGGETISGPGPNDAVCSTWALTTVNGQAVPVDLGGATLTGGSIQLLCTGWYRLQNVLDPTGPMEFVGRYDESGPTITFRGGGSHGPMTGTVTGLTLQVESVPQGGGSASYSRQ